MIKSYSEAINEALREEMARDPNVFIIGEDVGVMGGVFGVTDGLHAQFGEARVMDTPISEIGIIGAALGAALGLSTGGVAILATLAASASYIAAPTAMRVAVPEANAALSITAALGITFPFNIVIGIPLYIELARRISA